MRPEQRLKSFDHLNWSHWKMVNFNRSQRKIISFVSKSGKKKPKSKLFIDRILHMRASISYEAIKSFTLNIIYCPLVVISCYFFLLFFNHLVLEYHMVKYFTIFSSSVPVHYLSFPKLFLSWQNSFPQITVFLLFIMELRYLPYYSYRVGKSSKTLQVFCTTFNVYGFILLICTV